MSELEQSPLHPKTPTSTSWVKTNLPLLCGGLIILAGGLGLGYSVGHRQGLTVVGYDADAEQLAEVVTNQKSKLDILNRHLNAAVQERDVAVSSTKELTEKIKEAQDEKQQVQALSDVYREILRQRGGVSLTVQNIGIKPLPENAFEYQIDLVQVSPNHRRAAGQVELRLIKDADILVVPMEEASFNFENFARLTGRWTMPKSFIPQFIEVHVKHGSNPVIKRYSWQRGKAIENSPAFISEIPQTKANAD